MNSIKSVASALEVEMHNLEEKPRTHLVGVRWGYGGAFVGAACAAAAITWNWSTGNMSAYGAGISLGVVGMIVGVSCGFVGWASNR